MYTVSQIAWSVNLTLKFNIIYAIEKRDVLYSTFNTHACARSRTHTHTHTSSYAFFRENSCRKTMASLESTMGITTMVMEIIRKMDNQFFETLKSARICEIDIRYLSGLFIFCLSM